MAEPARLLAPRPGIARRDPAAIEADGVVHVFHTVVDVTTDPLTLWVEVTTSDDLRHWTAPERVTPPGPSFSSPGNIVRRGDEWVMCLQSYPIPPGGVYADDRCRLWTMRSPDLRRWSAPVELRITDGSGTQRRIDPFLVEADDELLCLHKDAGAIRALRSRDAMATWQSVSGPALVDPASLPAGETVENPAVLARPGGGWLLFASSVRAGRGIRVARGRTPLEWGPCIELDLPAASWAPGGLSAATVLATPARAHAWTMFIHGEADDPHLADLTLLVSDDLETWTSGR